MHVGILGGGQLARMMALAGVPLGHQFTFIDPAPDACAQNLGQLKMIGWDEPEAVAEALADCDCVTFDFENVPASTLAYLAKHHQVQPNPSALKVSQDRLTEKEFFSRLGIPVAPFASVVSRPELLAAIETIGVPAVLKTRCLGYDGKGQALIRSTEDLEATWQQLENSDLILEGWVDFHHECAITAVRDFQGDIKFYPLTHTVHEQGILQFALSPSPVNSQWQSSAEEIARTVLDELDYVGCLTIEFFVSDKGLIVNEFAPRVHNSAHWSIEGAVCSQFENHLRAISGRPLGQTQVHGHSLMINFIGQMPSQAMLEIPNLHWHDYGKKPREGRKVGHATWCVHDWSGLKAGLKSFESFLNQDRYQTLSGLVELAD